MGTDGTQGQADEGPQGTEITPQAPGGTEGQSVAGDSAGTTDDAGTQQAAEDTFFDPRDIADDPKLMAAYKNMQRSYGEKMEAIKADRQVIDAFRSDPLGTLQQYAKQYGLTVSPAQQQQQADSQNGTAPAQDPQTWDEVYKTAEERAYNRVQTEIMPVLQQVFKHVTEQRLDDVAPDWREHEDRMQELVAKHPSLANDPETLYELSLPKEVRESRATQAAMRKLQDKVKSATTSGVSTKKPTAGSGPQAKSIREAFEQAQRDLADQGVIPPGAI